MDLAKAAAKLLEDADLAADAARHAPLGHSVVGLLLSLSAGAPRQATEEAVLRALEQMRRPQGGKA